MLQRLEMLAITRKSAGAGSGRSSHGSVLLAMRKSIQHSTRISFENMDKNRSAHKNQEGRRSVVNQIWVPLHITLVPPGGGHFFQTALDSQERRRRREKGGHYPREYRATSSGVWRVEWETCVAEKHEQKTKTRCRTNPAKSTHPLREYFFWTRRASSRTSLVGLFGGRWLTRRESKILKVSRFLEEVALDAGVVRCLRVLWVIGALRLQSFPVSLGYRRQSGKKKK